MLLYPCLVARGAPTNPSDGRLCCVFYSVDGCNLIYSVLIDSVGGKLLGSVGGRV